MYELSNEVVIDIKLQKRVGSFDVARLLGLNTNYFNAKAFDASSKYLVEAMSEFERQVYLQPNQLKLLTDSRVIFLQQIRPIDMLAMLLKNFSENKFQVNQADMIEEFLDFYTVRESCSMLLQVCLEKDNYYLFSK